MGWCIFARDGDRGRRGQGVCSQVLLCCAKYPHVGILEREGHFIGNPVTRGSAMLTLSTRLALQPGTHKTSSSPNPTSPKHPHTLQTHQGRCCFAFPKWMGSLVLRCLATGSWILPIFQRIRKNRMCKVLGCPQARALEATNSKPQS